MQRRGGRGRTGSGASGHEGASAGDAGAAGAGTTRGRTAGKYKECGGCKLFAGAVNPEGNCLSWAAKKA